MKSVLALLLACSVGLSAAPRVYENVFGRFLGGWNAKHSKAVDYEVSGSRYRTWRPEVTPQIDGGIYVSLRIDHLRGMLATDDHASLELFFDKDGNVVSARSSLALQGKRVTSDLIRSTGELGKVVPGLDGAAKVGTDLVADLSSKILRENITEPGRVTFPSVIQHNYNYLCMSVGEQSQRAVPLDEDGNPIEAAGPVLPASQKKYHERHQVPLNRGGEKKK